MSNELAIAAVTRALWRLIDTGIRAALPPNLPEDVRLTNEIEVTTAPLDKARDPNNTRNQVNLFLYHVVPSATWRNMDIPRQVRPGETAQPPLPLNLYYLITAYGQNNNDLISHLLLGQVTRLLHDHAVLGRTEIQDALAASNLHEQIERVRITLQPLSLEEMSKLWTTFQTQYRISVAYEVAVVLIESIRPIKSPLPVLSRGEADRGVQSLTGALPFLEQVRLPRNLAAVRLGDEMTIAGQHLRGDQVRVLLRNQRQDSVFEPGQLLTIADQEITVKLPDPGSAADPASPTATWSAGFYTVMVVISRSDEPDRPSNQIPFALAPKITVSPTTAIAGNLTLTLTCQPMILPNQRVSLLFGDREIIAAARLTAVEALTFTVESVAVGQYVIRLRVDGVDSIPLDFVSQTPQFATDQQVEVTA